MNSNDLPAPYPRIPGNNMSPFSRRCDEIDAAALLIRDPDAFAETAKDEEPVYLDAHYLSRQHAFLEKPDGPYLRHFTEEGGCPAFRGLLNAGSHANVWCSLTDVQLHGYCELKFCVKGRRVYCPIWRAKGEKFNAEPNCPHGTPDP